MKKMLSVVLSALFVLGFAATVSANSAVQCAQPPIVAVDFQPPAGDQQPQQPTDHKKKKKQPVNFRLQTFIRNAKKP
ncbi:MAG: hypothetical protein H6Q74_2614 [Firmicutes bacterium]|nr:hypothetical protein [Bacillota bacterium]